MFWQVLCKNLEIDVAQLKPSIYLKDPERIRKIEFQLSQPIKKEQSTLVQSSQNTLMADTELANILPGQTSSSPVSFKLIFISFRENYILLGDSKHKYYSNFVIAGTTGATFQLR